jgi:glucose/arabinose dehydrogenase
VWVAFLLCRDFNNEKPGNDLPANGSKNMKLHKSQSSFLRSISLMIVAGLALAGCGSSNSGATSPPPPPPSASPTISGSPETFLYSGQAYDFTPTASDPDNDPLSFSISGMPGWMSFDPGTGRLQGAPDVSDAGLFSNITISVSDGATTTSLAPFSIAVEAFAPSGLNSRPGNLTCLAVLPPATADITLERMYSDLDLDDVTSLIQPPGDSSSWYFTTRDGLIGRFDNDPDVSGFTTVLDHTGTVLRLADGGLISMIFHHDYPNDRRVFVNYSVDPAGNQAYGDIIISSFVVSANGMSINPSSEVRLLRQPRGQFHQGGFMSFDSDGMLLFALGDGTQQRDPDGNAQNMADYRGKMHRIDVDSGSPYNIPNDNPYAGNGGSTLEEIFAHGFRNPYGGDIDPDSGRIFVGDVGLGSREEVSEVFSGGNLGWNIKEGSRCFSEQYGSCSDPTLIDPLVEYSHADGNCAVIGGYFYRGSLIPELQGRFLFADFCTSKISAVEFDNDGEPYELPLVAAGSGLGRVTSFAKDNDGEHYVVTGSQIHKVLPNNSNNGPTGPPEQLSQTGCFDSTDPTVPASCLIP